jgi:hypothetical protein
MIESGLPRTVATVGATTYEAAFARWLHETPPDTRYIREIIPAFTDFLLRTVPADPPWLHDLARYESARWTTGYEDVAVTTAGEFAFEKRAVVNPTVRLVPVEHRVHKRLEHGDRYERDPATLCVVRKQDDRVATLVLTDRSTAWLTALRATDGSVTDTITAVAEKREDTIDEAYVAALGSTLATFLENDVVLGAE